MLTLLLIHLKFLVQLVHQAHVDKDQDDKDIDRALLGKPETQFETAQPDMVQRIGKQNAAPIRNHKPDGEQDQQVSKVTLPVGVSFFHWVLKCLGVQGFETKRSLGIKS